MGACDGSDYALPDRSDPAVQAEESRLASIVNQDGRVAGKGTCEIRLLGTDDDGSYGWAGCSAFSGPVKVDSSGDIHVPRDGNLYQDDVERIFPSQIVSAMREEPRSALLP